MIETLNGEPKPYPGVMVLARCSILVIGQAIDEPTLTVQWQVHDTNGQLMLQGSADTVDVSGANIIAETTVQVPINIPATYDGEKYHLVWLANWDDGSTQSSEELIVYQEQAVAFGLEDSVNMTGYNIHLKGVVASDTTDDVTVTLFDPEDNPLTPKVISSDNSYAGRLEFEDIYETGTFWEFWNGHDYVIVHNPVDHNTSNHTYRTEPGGQVYAYDPDRSQQLYLADSLDPYTVHWVQSGNFIGTSQAWIISNAVSGAMHEMQSSMERALRYPGLLDSAFTNADYLMFLKMGRDLFNSLMHITNFTMLRADGHMRRMWLLCAQYEAATSRHLEEAIKAFDYSGQSTTLSVDVAAAYETYKSALEGQLESIVKPYKKQLVIRGLVDGDGDSKSLAKGKAPVVLSMTYSRVGSAAEYCIGSAYTKYLRPYTQMI